MNIEAKDMVNNGEYDEDKTFVFDEIVNIVDVIEL